MKARVPGRENHIVIAEEQEFAVGHLGSPVAGGGRPGVLLSAQLQPNGAALALPDHPLDLRISTSVVHNDDLQRLGRVLQR
jgi:hypothetical protein